MICFTVSDNGIGMSPEYLEQILNRLPVKGTAVSTKSREAGWEWQLRSV